jgi:hypothetical protein
MVVPSIEQAHEDGGSLTLFTVTVPVPVKCESLLVAEELVEP